MDMCTNGEALAVLANTAIQFRDGMNGLHDRVLRTARADCSKKALRCPSGPSQVSKFSASVSSEPPLRPTLPNGS